MTEDQFRGARLLAALANVIRFRIVVLLEKRRMTPKELATELRRSVPRISHHLAILRAADVVRFKVTRGEHRYWLKESGTAKICRQSTAIAKRLSAGDSRRPDADA